MKTPAPVITLLGLALSLSTAAWAQEGYTKLESKGKKAYSVPVSERTLTFEVTLPEKKSAKVLVKEGGMAKVGNLDEGYAFALVPIVKDMAKHTVAFTVFQLTQDEAGNESIRELQRVEASVGADIFTKTEPSFKIRLLSIDRPAE